MSCNGERPKKKHWSRIRSTKRGFIKKNVRGFRYKPRGDWFSFAKVRKLCFFCFLCSCKQTGETSISQRSMRLTSSAGTASVYDSQQKWEKSVYNIFNMDIFLTKTHGFVGGGLYPPPEPCEACFNMDWCTLFDYFCTVEQKHPSTSIIKLGRARIIFIITLIGFVWNKKVIYTEDALRVSKTWANFHSWVNYPFKDDFFQYFDFSAPSDSRFSNSCISAKYCPVINIYIWGIRTFSPWLMFILITSAANLSQ